MLARRLTFIVIFLLSYLLRSQGVADVFEDFTINDCVETPCQDIIVEGGVGGLSFKYIDCNCNTTGVYVPEGRVFVLKALVGKIEVAQGAFNPTGIISQPVSNTQYVEALEELIQTSFGSINNSIDITSQNICAGDQPTEITGYDGQFFDFDISYSWLKSFDNINYSYIRGARDKDYTPEVLSQTTYFKRQVYTAVSTGTYSDVAMVTVSDCGTNCSNPPQLNLTSTPGTINQVLCDGTPISTIVYQLGGAANQLSFTWTGDNSLAGSGLTTTISGTSQYIIAGIPTTNVTQSTVYTYQIETIGSACGTEVIQTGSIQIDPRDQIALVSVPGTDNQSICLMDNDNPQNMITESFMPIEYQLQGGAIGNFVQVRYNVDGGPFEAGLPAGLGYTLNSSNTIIISGAITASTTFVSPTIIYNYEITTGGACVTSTILGQITVHSPPVLNLTSAPETVSQTVVDQSQPITDILYTYEGGATNVIFSWTGSNVLNGINALTSNDQLIISGTPSTNVTHSTDYPYQIETVGSACGPEVVFTGIITVNPSSDNACDGLNQLFDLNVNVTDIGCAGPNFGFYEFNISGNSGAANYFEDGGVLELNIYELGGAYNLIINVDKLGNVSRTLSIPKTLHYSINGLTVFGENCSVSTGTFTINSPDNISITSTVTSGALSQTVTESTSIATTTVEFTLSCSETMVISAYDLPTGIQTSVTSNSITLYGTPSNQASGAYNYSIVATNTSGTATETLNGVFTVSSTSSSCTISGTLTSAAGTDSQTVSSSSSITAIEYTLSTTCSDTLNAAITWTPSTPDGVSMSFGNYKAITTQEPFARATISGTLSGTATGTYNYTITASNTAGTGSATFNGSLTVSSSRNCTATLINSICSQPIRTQAGLGFVILNSWGCGSTPRYTIDSTCGTPTISSEGFPEGNIYTRLVKEGGESTYTIYLQGQTATNTIGDYPYRINVFTGQNTLTINGIINVRNNDLVYIPDQNFQSQLSALGYPIIKNDYFVKSQIASITDLYFNGSGIDGVSDFTGLEEFQSLEKLLITTSNTNLPSATFIDVSNNQRLVKLAIISQPITSIDLSSNSLLTDIQIWNTSIRSLDLTSLNINNLTRLTFDNSEDLNCVILNEISLQNIYEKHKSSNVTFEKDKEILYGLNCQVPPKEYKLYFGFEPNSGSYLVTGTHRLGNVNSINPTLYLNTGDALVFNLSNITQPLSIKTSNTLEQSSIKNTLGPPWGTSAMTNSAITGATGSHYAGVKSYNGALMHYFTESGTYYYQSEDDINNFGKIIVSNITVISENCSITSSVTSGALNQSLTESTSIATTTVEFTSSCTDTMVISAYDLPPGIQTEITSNSITMFGTPSNQASGIYNYSLAATNTSGTATETLNGVFTISSSCTISGTLTSAAGTDSQTVSSSSSITAIEYTLSTTCSDTLNAAIAWTPNSPDGISMSFGNNIATISGTLSGNTTGTYNYTITASNTAGTGSATFNGSLTVSSSTSSNCGFYVSSGSSSQTLLLNSNIIKTTFKVGGNCNNKNYELSVTGLPPGINANISGNSVTLSGTLGFINSEEYIYSITASYPGENIYGDPTNNSTYAFETTGRIYIIPDYDLKTATPTVVIPSNSTADWDGEAMCWKRTSGEGVIYGWVNVLYRGSETISLTGELTNIVEGQPQVGTQSGNSFFSTELYNGEFYLKSGFLLRAYGSNPKLGVTTYTFIVPENQKGQSQSQTGTLTFIDCDYNDYYFDIEYDVNQGGFRFNGEDALRTINDLNPDLVIKIGTQSRSSSDYQSYRGDILNLNIDTPNHPVELIKVFNNSAESITTVSPSNTSVSSGTIKWNPKEPSDVYSGSTKYYYRCSLHDNEKGEIIVKRVDWN